MNRPNMENTLMKTAENIIADFQELARDQQEKVIRFVISVKEQEETNFLNQAFEEKYIQEENYSPEDIAVLDRLQEEAKQGINMSGPFHTTEELFAHLDSLQPE